MSRLTRMGKLRLAGQVAPTLRNMNEAERLRPIFLIDRNTGRVIGQTTLIKQAEAALLQLGIEIDTKIVRGKRPQALRCKCGMPFRVPEKGRIRRECLLCWESRHFCQNIINNRRCGRRLSKVTTLPVSVRARNGRPPMCRNCAVARSADRLREMNRGLDERSVRIRKLRTRAAQDSRDVLLANKTAHERRLMVESARRSTSRLPRLREAFKNMTPERRSERVRKSWETRRREARAHKK